MTGFLNKNKIDYVLHHFYQYYDVDDAVKQLFIFGNGSDKPDSSSIIFYLSEKSFDQNNVIIIDKIPVLFPIIKSLDIFGKENNNQVFYHDILKSAFYLLSSFQEISSGQSDFMGRFPFKDSVQYKLNFCHIPVVNYYFNWIKEGINQFCLNNNLPLIKRKSVFTNFGFMLTHDIDIVDKYIWRYTVYKIKELFGLVSSDLKKSEIFHQIVKSVFGFFHLLKDNNPYWNFEKLQILENKYQFKSVYYFLPKGQKNVDASYRFTEKRIKNLFQFLIENENEIGIHGTVNASVNKEVLEENINSLQNVSGIKASGVRMHRLSFDYPHTCRIIEQCGLKYDSTLGFAAHEGFRNSFCLPYKPYNFEEDRMFNFWEFPLNIMDTTLFWYQKYSYEIASMKTVDMIQEVKKFNGLLVLLWHNSYLDEIEFKGINEFYIQVLENIYKNMPETVTGTDILKKLN